MLVGASRILGGFDNYPPPVLEATWPKPRGESCGCFRAGTNPSLSESFEDPRPLFGYWWDSGFGLKRCVPKFP